jgi:hypothetical protein
METLMKENTRKARCMDRVGTCGILGNTMKDNGRRASRTVTVFGEGGRLTHTSDNGKITSLMGLVSTLGVTETSTRESGKLACGMVKEVTSLLRAMPMLENTNGVKQKDMANTYG